MHKLTFLCANHRRWLQEQPLAAITTWRQCYTDSLDLAEDGQLESAARSAGAAFDAAEIALEQPGSTPAAAVDRFSESAVLLVQLLFRLEQHRSAHIVLASAVQRLEQLLVSGMERQAVLSGCGRLMAIGDNVLPSAPSVQRARPRTSAVLSSAVH